MVFCPFQLYRSAWFVLWDVESDTFLCIRIMFGSVPGVMSFAMWISLVIVVFFVFNTCCLIKYAATQFFGGGGKQGRGGATWIGMFSLCCSGIRHITGFDGSSFCVWVAYRSV